MSTSTFDLSCERLIARLPLHPRLMLWTSRLGQQAVSGAALLLLGMVAFYLHLEHPSALFFAGFGAMVVSPYIKLAIKRQRPYNDDRHYRTPSFPSGHAYGSPVLGGLILVVVSSALSRSVFFVTTIIIVLYVAIIGISRVQRRAHFTSDVIGGWVLATAVVAIIAASIH